MKELLMERLADYFEGLRDAGAYTHRMGKEISIDADIDLEDLAGKIAEWVKG